MGTTHGSVESGAMRTRGGRSMRRIYHSPMSPAARTGRTGGRRHRRHHRRHRHRRRAATDRAATDKAATDKAATGPDPAARTRRTESVRTGRTRRAAGVRLRRKPGAAARPGAAFPPWRGGGRRRARGWPGHLLRPAGHERQYSGSRAEHVPDREQGRPRPGRYRVHARLSAGPGGRNRDGADPVRRGADQQPRGRGRHLDQGHRHQQRPYLHGQGGRLRPEQGRSGHPASGGVRIAHRAPGRLLDRRRRAEP